MKKKFIGRLGVVALALALVSASLMSGTLAKYTSQAAGTATATVANWSFKANGETSAMTAVDLGDTANRTAYSSQTIKEGVVAPGTSGQFAIDLDGSGSEVGIDYTLSIKAADGTSLPADLTFTTNSTGADAAYTLGQELSGSIGYSSTPNDMKKTVTVKWTWDFGASDTLSSNDNAYADKEWTLDIAVTGTQQTPAATPAP